MNAKLFQTLCSLSAAAAMLIAVAGCTSSEPTPAPTATDTPVPPAPTDTPEPAAGADPDLLIGEWTLTSFGDAATSRSPIPGTEITAEFSADGTVSGNGGCNGYQGSYRAEDGGISFGEVAITEMACSEPTGVMRQETLFVETFTSAETYRFAGGNLVVSDGSGGDLVFSRTPDPAAGSADPDSLIGAWTLTSFGDAATSRSLISGTEITAEFSDDGGVSGNGGCNGYQGSYQAGDGGISFGAVAITEMACSEPTGVMRQETRFMETFILTDTYRFADGNLVMTGGSGGELVFSRATDPSAGADPDSLIGEWTLTSFGDGATSRSLIRGTEITAVFSADGTVSGNAGCNGYQGSYQARDGGISFSAGAITEMACSEPVGVLRQETQFMETLTSSETYRFTDGNLVLSDGSGGELVFSRAPDPAAGADPDSLIGEWTLTSFVDGATSHSLISGTEITAVFSADGTVSGNGGCNGYQGSYRAEDSGISFGAVAITAMACSTPEGVMRQETQFVESLTSAETYRFTNGDLVLTDGSGGELVFSRATG